MISRLQLALAALLCCTATAFLSCRKEASQPLLSYFILSTTASAPGTDSLSSASDFRTTVFHAVRPYAVWLSPEDSGFSMPAVDICFAIDSAQRRFYMISPASLQSIGAPQPAGATPTRFAALSIDSAAFAGFQTEKEIPSTAASLDRIEITKPGVYLFEDVEGTRGLVNITAADTGRMFSGNAGPFRGRADCYFKVPYPN